VITLSGWQLFGFSAIPGWTGEFSPKLSCTAENQAAYPQLELQTNKPWIVEGQQWIELAAVCNTQISQSITTVSGKVYTLTFDYAPLFIDSTANPISVYWNNVLLATVSGFTFVNHNPIWSTYKYTVTGTGFDTIKFVAIGYYGAGGGLIDEVNLKSKYPEFCVNTMTVLPNSNPGASCAVPTLSCIKLVDEVPQTPTTGTTCVKKIDVSGSIFLSQPGQKVYLSDCPQACSAPYFDELATIYVYTPSGNLSGANYVGQQNDCKNPALPLVTVTTAHAPAIDITSLFGEVGSYTVRLTVWNKYSPTSNTDVYICTGSSPDVAHLTEASTLNDNIDPNSKPANGYSSILIAVLSSVGACTLIFGIIIVVIIKKTQVKFNSGLTEQLQ